MGISQLEQFRLKLFYMVVTIPELMFKPPVVCLRIYIVLDIRNTGDNVRGFGNC